MYFRYYSKIVVKTIVWAFVLTGLVITMAWLMVLCASNLLPEFKANLWIKLISLVVTFIIIVKFHSIFLRYPFQKTFRARRVINAPVETVWEQVRPTARDKPYNVFHSSIRKVGTNIYRYYLAKSSDSDKEFFHVKLTYETPYKALKLDFADEISPDDFIKTSRGTTYMFKSLNDNKTEIKVSETHFKPSLLTFYALEFMGAHRDDLRQLANVCEGQMNISWASAQLAMDEIAAHPDATLGDVFRPIGDGILIGITALMTAITMVIVWAI